jgi:hypothetical protein
MTALGEAEPVVDACAAFGSACARQVRAAAKRLAKPAVRHCQALPLPCQR